MRFLFGGYFFCWFLFSFSFFLLLLSVFISLVWKSSEEDDLHVCGPSFNDLWRGSTLAGLDFQFAFFFNLFDSFPFIFITNEFFFPTRDGTGQWLAPVSFSEQLCGLPVFGHGFSFHALEFSFIHSFLLSTCVLLESSLRTRSPFFSELS